MNAETGSNSEDKDKGRRGALSSALSCILKAILHTTMAAMLVVFLFALLCGIYIVLVLTLKRGPCVVLPNGYMIGYSSILNPSPDGLFKMVLRDPSGEIILRTDYSMKFVRHPDDDRRVIAKFPGGIDFDLPGEELMLAILYLHPYQLDKEDPEYSSKTWPQIAKGLPEGESLGWYGIGLVYEKLTLSKKFKGVSCGTPWFDPGD